MCDLVAFAKRLEAQLTMARNEPHWKPEEAERYMAEVAVRRDCFEQLALRLKEAVIQPRLGTLASYFTNASLFQDEPAGRFTCRFGYCERFPASTRVSFSVEHDVRYENLAVCYEASMMPLFIKLNDRDRWTSAIDSVQEDSVASWVEARLLEFLAAYLRIDRGGEDFEEEAATDPVCGMRINRSSAAASDSHRGHPYFFCSRECQERFKQAPTAYVDVTTN